MVAPEATPAIALSDNLDELVGEGPGVAVPEGATVELRRTSMLNSAAIRDPDERIVGWCHAYGRAQHVHRGQLPPRLLSWKLRTYPRWRIDASVV